MKGHSSATTAGRIALNASAVATRLLAWVVRGWHDAVYLQETLSVFERPWEHEGALVWRRELGGCRLVGSYMPDAEVDASGPTSSASAVQREKKGAGPRRRPKVMARKRGS